MSNETGGKMPHGIVLEERKKLSVTGVHDVDSFDEQSVLLKTEQGGLKISGNNLQITGLSLETGDITVTGNISAIEYKGGGEKGGFLSRLVK